MWGVSSVVWREVWWSFGLWSLRTMVVLAMVVDFFRILIRLYGLEFFEF